MVRESEIRAGEVAVEKPQANLDAPDSLFSVATKILNRCRVSFWGLKRRNRSVSPASFSSASFSGKFAINSNPTPDPFRRLYSAAAVSAAAKAPMELPPMQLKR